MIRSAFANIYRTPAFAAGTRLVNRAGSNKVAYSAFIARRSYTDKAEDKAADKKPEEAKENTKEGSSATTVSAEEFEKLKKSVAEKDAKIKELKDAYLRSLAEAENIRTRSKTEIENNKLFAIQKFAKDLLDTVDILELAIKHVPQEPLADKVANKPLVDLHEG
ncbi:GrpE, mitochondrial, partial [Coemansia sp. RSA 2703]